MGISTPRDLEALRKDLTRWLRAWRPDAADVAVRPLEQPATGLSSETVFVEADLVQGKAAERVSAVLRLPPRGEGLFPAYDLVAQGRLQAAVAAAGVRAVAPLAVEGDASWLGDPFFLMPRVAGRVVQAAQPYLRRGWLADASPEQQRTLHGELLDTLASIHRLDWRAARCDSILGSRLGGGGTRWLASEVEHWARYLDWAGGGTAPSVFDDGLRWCREHLPAHEPPPSLLWGDAQLGNLLVGPDMRVNAVLDFELACIGPAEVDLAWHLTLHHMAVARCGGDLPGFPDRGATVAAYEERLGRTLDDLQWYEAFAALRSGAVLVRAAHLLARLGVDDSWLTQGNPTVALLAELIA